MDGTKHHFDGFRSTQVMLGAPEHPLDALIASKGHFFTETNNWMGSFFKTRPVVYKNLNTTQLPKIPSLRHRKKYHLARL
jgi:hypothetical protein